MTIAYNYAIGIATAAAESVFRLNWGTQADSHTVGDRRQMHLIGALDVDSLAGFGKESANHGVDVH